MNFLTGNKESATHFLIGSNIIDYPDAFKQILASGDDLAVSIRLFSSSCTNISRRFTPGPILR